MIKTSRFGYDLELKDFKIHLPSLDEWCVAHLGDQFCGLMQGDRLSVRFLEDPGPEVIAALLDYWNKIDKDAETKKWDKSKARDLAVKDAQEAMVTSDMTKWSGAERKVFMRMPLTNDDMDSLTLKFPKK